MLRDRVWLIQFWKHPIEVAANLSFIGGKMRSCPRHQRQSHAITIALMETSKVMRSPGNVFFYASFVLDGVLCGRFHDRLFCVALEEDCNNAKSVRTETAPNPLPSQLRLPTIPSKRGVTVAEFFTPERPGGRTPQLVGLPKTFHGFVVAEIAMW